MNRYWTTPTAYTLEKKSGPTNSSEQPATCSNLYGPNWISILSVRMSEWVNEYFLETFAPNFQERNFEMFLQKSFRWKHEKTRKTSQIRLGRLVTEWSLIRSNAKCRICFDGGNLESRMGTPSAYSIRHHQRQYQIRSPNSALIIHSRLNCPVHATDKNVCETIGWGTSNRTKQSNANECKSGMQTTTRETNKLGNLLQTGFERVQNGHTGIWILMPDIFKYWADVAQ